MFIRISALAMIGVFCSVAALKAIAAQANANLPKKNIFTSRPTVLRHTFLRRVARKRFAYLF